MGVQGAGGRVALVDREETGVGGWTPRMDGSYATLTSLSSILRKLSCLFMLLGNCSVLDNNRIKNIYIDRIFSITC